MKFLVVLGILAAAIIAFVTIALALLATTRPDLSEFDGRYAPLAKGPVTVQFFGTSSMLFSDGKTQVMIDGWFSRPSTAALALGKVQPDIAAIEDGLSRLGNPKVAALIVVHSHLDHAMDVAEVAKRTGALLVGSGSTANIGRGGGLSESQIRVVRDGEKMRFGDFAVSMIESRHFVIPKGPASPLAGSDVAITIDEPLVPPASAYAYHTGDVYSVVVEHPAGSALIQSSAGFKEGSLEAVDVDAVYLGVGFLASQTAEYQETYWREVVTQTRPEGIYAIHWDSFSRPIADVGNRPAAPNRIWNDLLRMRTKAGIEFAFRRAEEAGIRAALLPMWEEVDAFTVAAPAPEPSSETNAGRR